MREECRDGRQLVDVKRGRYGCGTQSNDAVGTSTLPVFVARYQRWGRSVGLSQRDTYKLLTEAANDSTLWRRPEIAALLSPGKQTDGPSGAHHPTTAQGYCHANESVVQQLPDHLARLGRESVAAARQLNASVDAAEKEIEKLAKDADASEIARLEERD